MDAVPKGPLTCRTFMVLVLLLITVQRNAENVGVQMKMLEPQDGRSLGLHISASSNADCRLYYVTVFDFYSKHHHSNLVTHHNFLEFSNILHLGI